MSSVSAARHPAAFQDRPGPSARAFAVAALALALGAALLAGWAPVWFSIVTVFLFAGPHNWAEFRFFLSRMPARWGPAGPLRAFFLLAIAGVVFLAAGFAAVSLFASRGGWGAAGLSAASSAWCSVLLLWIASLAHLRAKEKPGRDWGWVWPTSLLGIAGVWIVPAAWEVGIVYLHPLIALCFLQRELHRKRPEWLPAYYGCLAAVPLLLLLLWWRLGTSPALPGVDGLTLRITRHAGAGVVPGLSSHFLVSAHTFLEMLHYGVWLAAIPLLSLRSAPWDVQRVPLFRRSTGWAWGVRGIVVGGAVLVLLLWGCFLTDYPLTRDIYFTVAIAHVLAEFPFLLRTF